MNFFSRKMIIMFAFTVIFATGTVAQAATATVGAQSSIVQPTLTLTPGAALDFGTVIPAITASTITVNASAGTATPTVLGNANVTGGSSGVIAITTNIDANVTVACTEVSSIVTGAGTDDELIAIFGGTNTVGTDAVALTKANVGANSTATGLAITAAGPNAVNVGGVISVTNALTTGTYSGTIVFTIAYQ